MQTIGRLGLIQTSSQGQSCALLPMSWADVRQLWSRGCAAVSLLHHCRYRYRQPPYAAPGRSRGLPAPAPTGNSLVLLAEVPGAQLWLCWTKAGASAAGWSANQARRFIFFFSLQLSNFSGGPDNESKLQFCRNTQNIYAIQQECTNISERQKGTKQVLVSHCLMHRWFREPESRKLAHPYMGKQQSFRRVLLKPTIFPLSFLFFWPVRWFHLVNFNV